MNDLISRQAAIDALKVRVTIGRANGKSVALKIANDYADIVKKRIEALPSAQLEQSNSSEFWRKRADFYSDMCMDLIGEMGKGVKVESVQISENGIAFIKEQPSAQPEETCDTCKHGYFGSRQCDNCRVGYPSHYERRTDETD